MVHPSNSRERRVPRLRSFSPGAAGLLCAGVLACATVTQEDPPSGRGLDGVQPSGGGGSGATPLTDRAEPPGQPSAPSGTPPAGESPAPPSGLSSGGSGGSGGSPVVATADAGPGFASGMVLLEENFENFAATSPAWAPSADSEWEVQTDPELVSNVYTQTETTRSQPNLSVAGSTAWRDVVVEADMLIRAFNGSSSSYMAGLCVRVRDSASFYLIGIRSNDGKLGLRRYADGGSNLIQSDFDQGTTGVWYRLRVEAVGATLTAYLDDQLMFSHTDDDLPNGGIGLCTVRAAASFDNVRVTAR